MYYGMSCNRTVLLYSDNWQFVSCTQKLITQMFFSTTEIGYLDSEEMIIPQYNDKGKTTH